MYHSKRAVSGAAVGLQFACPFLSTWRCLSKLVQPELMAQCLPSGSGCGLAVKRLQVLHRSGLRAVLHKLCNVALENLALPAEHVKGKRGHGMGFLGFHWQCWCLLFTTFQLISVVHGNCAKSSTGSSELHLEEIIIKIEDTEHVIMQRNI